MGPGQSVSAVSSAAAFTSTRRNPAALSSSGYGVFLPRTVAVTPSGKLVGDLLQDLPPGSSLGTDVTDGIFYKQKSVGKPQKYSWRKN